MDQQRDTRAMPPPPELWSCCGCGRSSGTGARRSYGQSWQVSPSEVPAAEPLDDLDAASVTIGQLRRFLTEPAAPAEDAGVQQWLDRLLGRTSA
jgi:hypothetical protein